MPKQSDISLKLPDDIPGTVYTEPFQLADEKACQACPNSLQCQPKTVLCVDNRAACIKVMPFEEFIDSLYKQANSPSKCDVLMTDMQTQNCIVFCEMTCSQEKYVEPYRNKPGKRAKALQQMIKAVQFLDHYSQEAHNYLENAAHKICLFAWRDPAVPEQPALPNRRSPQQNMLAFNTTPSNMAKSLSATITIDDFKFLYIQNKYPHPFSWHRLA